MHLKMAISTAFLAGIALCNSGCALLSDDKNLEAEAIYTSQPIKVDGQLDEKAWSTAPGYAMNPAPISKMTTGGVVKFLWDDKYLYVGAKFYDEDVIAENTTNQMHHYKFGDLLELFIRPPKNTMYWELYCTPLSNKSAFFLPNGGRCFLPSCGSYTGMKGMKVAAKINGTVNNWRDKDKGWTAEMAVPIKDLTAYGDKFGPGQAWRFFIGRYNYSRYNSNLELLGITDFKDGKTSYHYKQNWGTLKIVKEK
jgi:Carbohydrate family 9 binding domain-like